MDQKHFFRSEIAEIVRELKRCTAFLAESHAEKDHGLVHMCNVQRGIEVNGFLKIIERFFVLVQGHAREATLAPCQRLIWRNGDVPIEEDLRRSRIFVHQRIFTQFEKGAFGIRPTLLNTQDVP